jgi:hypothetical protein
MQKSKTDYAVERIKWHLNVPCCQTKTGLAIHFQAIGIKERWFLAYWLKATLDYSDPNDLFNKMWRLIKGCKNRD